MIQWNAGLARRLVCTEAQKRGLAPLIRLFMDIAHKSQVEGFRSLESELASIDDPLFSIGLRLVMEGIEGEALEDILATYLLTENRSGWPFLRACVIIEGLLSLADDDNPALMARKLVSYYGAEHALAALEELEKEGRAPARPESMP